MISLIYVCVCMLPGAAHARFELVPDSDYDKPMLCMRIVEMIEPVKCRIKNYDGYIHPPREGKLITYGPPGLSCVSSPPTPPFLAFI